MRFPSLGAMARNRQSAAPLVLAIALFWTAAVTINYGSRSIYPHRIERDVAFVPAREVVDFLCLDHRGLAADLLVIRVILHTGSLAWKPAGFTFQDEWSYRMIDLATDLDPHNLEAYLFAGMGLVHSRDDVYRARPILDKGMRYFPDNWELPFWAGFDHYMIGDYPTASDYLWRAAHLPGAPTSFLSLLYASLTETGVWEKGIDVLQMLIRTTENDAVVRVYEKRIVRLQNLIFLQKAVQRFRQRYGRYPDRLADLVASGTIPSLPHDSMGKRYVWNSARKMVQVADSDQGSAP